MDANPMAGLVQQEHGRLEGQLREVELGDLYVLLNGAVLELEHRGIDRESIVQMVQEAGR